MDWIKAILDKHVGEDGKLDVAKAEAEIKTEFPKHAVPKATFNEKLTKIKELESTQSGGNQVLEDLKAKLKVYEEKEVKQNIETQIKEALTEAGATDVDYMMFKLGKLEAGEDGKIPFLKQQVEDLKLNHTNYFAEKQGDEGGDKKIPDGYKSVSGKLPEGKEPPKDTSSDFINAFTADLPKAK